MRVAVVPSWWPTLDDPVRGSFFVHHVEALRLEHEVEVVSPPRGSSLPAFVASTRRELRRRRPDVVHAHVAVPAGLAALVARVAPVVLTEHSGPLDRLYGRSRVRRAAVCRIFDRVGALAIPSDTLRRELLALGVARVPAIVPNPVGPVPAESRPEPGLVVAVGLMDDRTKGFGDLLAAWPAVVGAFPGARLHIVGGGRYEAEYRVQAAGLAIADSVLFTGTLPPDATLERIARADVFASASVHETFGHVLVQAAALGVPVVATRVGVAPDLVTPETGVLVSPAAPDALAEALRHTLDHATSFDRQAIRERALERYGPKRVCTLTTALFEEAVSRAASRRG